MKTQKNTNIIESKIINNKNDENINDNQLKNEGETREGF